MRQGPWPSGCALVARDHQTIQLSGQKDVKATHQNPEIMLILLTHEYNEDLLLIRLQLGLFPFFCVRLRFGESR
jgi:hypothetical protein